MGETIKFPKQCVSIKRTTKVLGVDAELYRVEEDSGVSPLQIYSGFSRMVFTIIDTDSGFTPTANIPSTEIENILQETISIRNAVNIRDVCGLGIPAKAAPASTSTVDTSGPAYTVKLLDNNFKNMTPAEVLIKDPANKEKLLGVKKWLEANVSKYPRNSVQIGAIDEAIKLLEAGSLSADNVPVAAAPASDSVRTIYNTDFKFKSAKNDKGYNLVYSISIKYDTNPEKNYPITIKIDNMYAPVETGANGQKKIVMSKAEDKKSAVMNLTYKEWADAINHINRINNDFAMVNYNKQFKIADDNSYHHE